MLCNSQIQSRLFVAFKETTRPYTMLLFSIPLVLAAYVLTLIGELKGDRSVARLSTQPLLPLALLAGCVCGRLFPKVQDFSPLVITIVASVVIGEEAVTTLQDFPSFLSLCQIIALYYAFSTSKLVLSIISITFPLCYFFIRQGPTSSSDARLVTYFSGALWWAFSGLLVSIFHYYGSVHSQIHDKCTNTEEELKQVVNRSSEGVLIIKNKEVSYHNPALLKTLKISEVEQDTTSEIKSQLAACLLPEEYMNQQEMRTLQPFTANLLDYLMADLIQDFSFLVHLDKCRLQVTGSSTDFAGSKAVLVFMRDVTREGALESSAAEAKRRTLLIASASHELRTPLNGVISMLELLAEGVAPEMEEYYKIAVSSSQFLLIVVNDILDFAQLGEGELRLNYEFFDPKEVVKGCIELVSINAKKKGLELMIDQKEGLPEKICSDQNRFRQILLNLLSNAIKFTLKGHVKVKLSLHSGMFLKCSVTDTGIGMPERALNSLFFPYVKGEDKEGMNKAGCGLGLAVSKSLAENLGGYITAKSSPGKGSTFTFAVAANLDGDITSTTYTCKPLKGPIEGNPGIYGRVKRQFTSQRCSIKHVPGVKPKARISLQQPNKRPVLEDSEKEELKKCQCPKILVVDDTPLNVFALKQILLKLGLKIDEATNGAEALERIKQRAAQMCCKRYRLVFMDCNMPVMDGLDATREIKRMSKDGEIKETPVIGMSAYSGEAEVRLCQEVGMAETMCKPVTMAKLDEKLIQYGLKCKKSLFNRQEPNNNI